MEFKPIKPKKIYEEIVDQLKGMITRGELSPGDKLLPERELADQLQVGRSAVREAYRALEAIGIIEIRAGEGTFVRELNTKSMTDIMSFAVITGKGAILELLELRKIIEIEAAALAAERLTKDNLINLKKCLDKMKEDVNKGVVGEVSDLIFHHAITEAAHNSLLTRVISSVSDTMKTEMKKVRERMYETPGRPEILYKQHEEIYQAIVNRDPAEARKAMLNHLVSTEQVLIQVMNKDKI
ncbi:transcriptional regulator, GntR family [Desulforamulus reducens MI-1]|uniref:Transcriptional regulator, GntR family n=1 Tax=Desulforamulus reducens (strain ATCC BAA-1160 / DSM 100696 / MI-1) TaxID=349161 RepID=A4J6J9_DESRM|nr:FadR/GntR family transcriptional regulator [Desulforamulus reducens]ABO50702.1 transcriptional regulator, GntR family [Desulforamulus reducens MI-1]